MKMKKIFNYAVIGLLSITSLFVSCEEKGPEGDNVPVGPSHGTAVLEAKSGSTTEFTFTAENAWVISNTNTWVTMTPNSGQAGSNTITMTATKDNNDMVERIKPFTIIDGSRQKTFYVVQRGIIATEVNENDKYILAGENEFSFAVSGTYPLDKITVTTDAKWLEFSSIKDIDSTLLVDSTTYSSYKEGVAVFTVVEQNNEVGAREAKVTVAAGEQTFDFTVLQQSNLPVEADYTKDFYKASVIMKFTGTWCGNCPIMSDAIHKVQEEEPGRLLMINCYDSKSSNNLPWAGSASLQDHFAPKGYPAGFFNGYAEIINAAGNVTESNVKALVDESVTKFTNNVMLAAISTLDGKKVNIDVNIASKVSGEYKLTVFFLEDGIEAAQTDYANILKDPDHYIHTDILRGAATVGYANGGDAVTLTANNILNKKITADVPSNIVDIDNAKILIYVTHLGKAEVETVVGPENTVIYGNYGWVVDNAILLPINGFADFKYEK